MNRFIKKVNKKNLIISFCVFMSFLILFLILINSNVINVSQTNTLYNANEGIDPTQWVAVDGVGRTVPTNGVDGVSTPKGKYVGIMYWTWHAELGKSRTNPHPYNLSTIYGNYPDSKNNPNHSVWSQYSASAYWWNEPIYGYYQESDDYVLRKQAELLADAGVDFVVFDCTNVDYTWETEYMNLLKVWSEAKSDGVKVPKVVFMLGFSPSATTKSAFNKIYNSLYSKNLYQDLWFYMGGASTPLILTFPEVADTDAKRNFFTFRPPVADYYLEGQQSYTNEIKWGWLSTYPQAVYMDLGGNKEMTTVGIAQNMTQEGKSTQKLTAMNGSNVMGRSYAANNYTYSYKYRGVTKTIQNNMTDGTLYGRNFQQQWDYAINQNPGYVLVTGWNEWLVQRQVNGWPPTSDSRNLPVSNAFPDQFNDEFSRDIEPSKGSLKDNYYYQLVSNVRKYKGASTQKKQLTPKTIDINGNVNQWTDSNIIDYKHYKNTSATTRNSKQWGYSNSVTYTNDTFNNDIVNAKVSYDTENIYFYVECRENITNYKNKLRLLIDTVESKNSTATNNYEEFEYILNRTGATDNTLRLEKSTGGWNWSTVSNVSYVASGKVLQIAIPRRNLGLTSDAINFNFKWADNNLSSGNIMTVYTDGDTAPGGRFAFHFEGSASYSPQTYSITYNLNGGTLSNTNPDSYTIDSDDITLNNPTKTGYTFTGWTGSNGSTPEKTVTITKGSTGNKTYTANFSVNRYTITFNSNGGSSVNSITANYNESIQKPTDPSRNHYTFNGWYEDEGLTRTYTFTTMPAKNFTLYAGWTANTYQITFNSNGGSEVAPITGTYNSRVVEPTDPTKDGYKFAGWYEEDSLTNLYSFTTMPGENITLYAKWINNANVIRYKPNGGTIAKDSPTSYTTGEEVNLKNPVKDHYNFGGWFLDENLTQEITKITSDMDGDITLYAKWIVNKYTISFNTNGGNDIPTKTFDYGESITNIPTPVKRGNTFAGWFLDEQLTVPFNLTTMPGENITLYAKWISDSSYSIIYELNGGINNENNPTAYRPGEELNIQEPTKEGYIFKGWYLDKDFKQVFSGNTTEMTGDIPLYAKWEEKDIDVIIPDTGASKFSTIIISSILLISGIIIIWFVKSDKKVIK